MTALKILLFLYPELLTLIPGWQSFTNPSWGSSNTLSLWRELQVTQAELDTITLLSFITTYSKYYLEVHFFQWASRSYDRVASRWCLTQWLFVKKKPSNNLKIFKWFKCTLHNKIEKWKQNIAIYVFRCICTRVCVFLERGGSSYLSCIIKVGILLKNNFSMQEGREMGTYCICITDSLCYKAEANTPL